MPPRVQVYHNPIRQAAPPFHPVAQPASHGRHQTTFERLVAEAHDTTEYDIMSIVAHPALPTALSFTTYCDAREVPIRIQPYEDGVIDLPTPLDPAYQASLPRSHQVKDDQTYRPRGRHAKIQNKKPKSGERALLKRMAHGDTQVLKLCFWATHCSCGFLLRLGK